jgi:hypothetical protein
MDEEGVVFKGGHVRIEGRDVNAQARFDPGTIDV